MRSGIASRSHSRERSSFMPQAHRHLQSLFIVLALQSTSWVAACATTHSTTDRGPEPVSLVTPSPTMEKRPGVREADVPMVAGCAYLTDVVGSAPHSIEAAKADALAQGVARTATHIVWSCLVANKYSWGELVLEQFSASGKLYRCSKP
jgi:hypothetical protein